MYFTLPFFVVPTVGPVVGQVVLSLPPTSIERLISNQLDSQTRNIAQFAPVIGPRVDKFVLTDKQIEELDILYSKFKNGSITMEEAILELRGGDLSDWLVLFVFFYMIANHTGESFLQAPLPHMDPVGWINGKYNNLRFPGQSRPEFSFERKYFDSRQMCTGSEDENGFVMSYEQAYDLVANKYPGYMSIDDQLKASDWQIAKKAYHGQKGFGLDLDKYDNITKDDLVTLQNTKGGLIKYVQKGGRLLPKEFIKDFQKKIYDFCHLENTEVIRDAKHYGTDTGETPAVMYVNKETRQIVMFNQIRIYYVYSDQVYSVNKF